MQLRNLISTSFKEEKFLQGCFVSQALIVLRSVVLLHENFTLERSNSLVRYTTNNCYLLCLCFDFIYFLVHFICQTLE